MKYFIKHVPSPLRSKFVESRLGKPGVQVMATDYTSFESHFVPELMRICEMEYYRHMVVNLHDGPLFLSLVETLAGTNFCSFKNVKAEVFAGRMSGEMNTSLGNSFTNLMFYLFIHDQLGNSDYDCLIEGDDCLGVFKGRMPTSKMYADLGMTVKIEFPKSLNVASFCGQVFTADHVVVTDPIKAYLNVGWAPAIYSGSSAKTRRELLNCKARSLLYEHSGCPIVTSMCRYILKNTTHYRVLALNPYERARLVERMKSPLVYREVSMEARQLVQDLYGVPILAQILAEQWFDSRVGFEPLDCPYLYPFISRACLDYDREFVILDWSRHFERMPLPGPAAVDPGLIKYYATQGTQVISPPKRSPTS